LNPRFSKPRTFLDRLKGIFKPGNVKEYIEDIEAALYEADIDISIVDELSRELREEKLSGYEQAAEYLRKIFREKLTEKEPSAAEKEPLYVILLTGMNGGGKTTTAAKLANLYKNEGKTVVLCAADTFRAAAIEQLASWGEKLGVTTIKGTENGDPAAAAFDSVVKAKAMKADVLIIDTAGRLHTKANLMQELQKVKRVVLREVPERAVDSFLIVDANIGKNAYVQAREFNSALGLTGVILTKFDSSAKGGSIIHIKADLNLPVRFLGFGEGVNDIERFSAERFTAELFD